MPALSTNKIVRFVLAPLLSLWVAGAGCMLGCEGMVAAAVMGAEQHGNTSLNSAQGVTIVASGHACSSGSSASKLKNKAHNCCKQSSSGVKPKVERLSTDAASLLQFGASPSGMM